MNKKGHRILGLIFALAFIFGLGYLEKDIIQFGVSSLFIVSFIITVYSILPDIDHPSGTMTWWFLGLGILGLVFSIILMFFQVNIWLTILIVSVLFLLLTFLAAHIIPHRGFIHSISFGILAVLPLWYLFNNIFYCLLGYVVWHSHLIGDGYIFKLR